MRKKKKPKGGPWVVTFLCTPVEGEEVRVVVGREAKGKGLLRQKGKTSRRNGSGSCSTCDHR